MPLISTIALLLLASQPVRPSIDPGSEEALVEEVRAVNELADHRPTHVPAPLEGTFASLATPHLVRLEALGHQQGIEVSKGLGPFIEGERSWDSVPTAVRGLVESAAPDAMAVLEASHASSGRLSPNLTGLMPLLGKMPEDSILFTTRVAAAQVRRLVIAHDGKALAGCIDALGVARDLSYGNALARTLASSAIRIFTPICLDAMKTERPSLASCEQLRSVADRTAPLSAMLEQEKIFGELTAFGSTLSDETRAQLPPEAIRVANQAWRDLPFQKPVRFAKVRTWLFGGWARRDLAVAMDSLIAAADRPPAIADPVLAKLDEEHQPWSWKFLGGDDSPSTWLRFARSWREAQTRLNAISAACTLLVSKKEDGWSSLPGNARDARTGQPLELKIIDSQHVTLIAEGDPARDAKPLGFAVSTVP